MKTITHFLSLALLLLFAVSFVQIWATQPRNVISLDDIWQITEGTLNDISGTFSRTVLVPGLVDLVEPTFDDFPQGAQRPKISFTNALQLIALFCLTKRGEFSINGLRVEIEKLKIKIIKHIIPKHKKRRHYTRKTKKGKYQKYA